MNRIDTHLHLWDLNRFSYAWCAEIPALNRSFLPADYRAAAHGTGIAKAVFVECDVDEPHALAEAQMIQQLAEGEPGIAGLIASARPERTDFPEQLEALLQLPKLRGLRRVLHVVPDATSQSPVFAENLRRLAKPRLTFDLCVLARQLPVALALVDQCPEVQFILDHCGVPDIKGGAWEPWHTHLAKLSARPNVACKISGLPTYAPPGWTPPDLRPWVDHVIACFGRDRILWGGDWPVCTLNATLQQWVAATDELMGGASETERQHFFCRNAENIYRV